MLATAALFTAADAQAHGSFGSFSPFWVGALHLLVAPLALAALLGYGAYIAGSEKVLDSHSVFTCAASAGLFSIFPGLFPTHILAVGVCLVGLAAMLRIKAPRAVTQVVGVFIGAIIGISVDLDNQRLIPALGVSATTLFLEMGFLGLWDRGTEIIWLRPILPLASQVLGSWVGALGLLLVALGFRTNP